MTVRNDVMSAILATIQGMTFSTPINGSTTWKFISNRLKLWSDVNSDQQPAAFLVTHQEMDEYRGMGLLRRRLNLGVWCYCRANGGIGGPMLDTMMESFEDAFITRGIDDPGQNLNTLGGLVYFCRIEGRVFKDPGDIDNQTMLIVPLVVEMP